MVVENTMNQEIEKLINRAPNSEKDKKLRGYIVAKLAFEKYGKMDVAKKYLDLYLEERPQNIPALLLMGDILFSQKSYKEAYFYYTKIYDINSSQKEVLLKICNCLIKCQNMDEEESKKWLNITQEFYGNKDVVRQLKHKINLKSFNNSSINGHIHSNVNDENFYDTFNSITSPIKSEPVDKENFYSPQSPAYHSPIQSPNSHNSLFRLSNLKKDSCAQKEVLKIAPNTPTLPVLKGPPLFRNDSSFRSSTNALSSPKLPSSSTSSLSTREIFNSYFGNNSTFKEPEFASSNEKSMIVSSVLNSTSHITTTVPKSLANETFNNGGNIIINVITPNPQQHQQQPSNIDDGKQSSETDVLDSKETIEKNNVKTEKTLQQSLLISTFEKSITTAMQEMTQLIQRLTENFEKTLTSNTDMIKNMVETNTKTLQTQSQITAAVKANDELLKDILVQLNNLALSQQSTHAQIDMLRTQPLSHRYFPNNLMNMNTNTPIDYNQQMQQSMLMWQNQHFQTPQPLPGLYNTNLLYDQANNYLPNNINNVIWSSHLNANNNTNKDMNISNIPPSLPQTTINIKTDSQPIKHTSTIDFNFGKSSVPITTSLSSNTKIITNKTSNSCHHNNSKLSFAYPSTGGGFGGSKSAVLTPTLKGHSFSESHDLDENDIDESLQQLEDEQLSLAKLPAFSFKPFNEIKVSSPSDLKTTTKSQEKPQQLISVAKTFNLNNFEQIQNQDSQKVHSSEELNESDTSDEYSQTSETTNNESSTPDEQTHLNMSNQIFTAPILKQPTWFCEVCYCENSCDANKCLACESVRKIFVNPTVSNQSLTNVIEQPLEMAIQHNDIKSELDEKNTSLLSNKSLVSEMPSKFSFAFTLPVPTVKTPLSDNKVSSFSFDLPSKVEKISKSPLETSPTVYEGGEGEGDESINDSMVNYNNPVTPPSKMEREEKGQHVLFAERAKLYRYDTETKEWKERGLGMLKILQEMPPTEKANSANKLGPNKLGPNAKPGKKRIILRRDHIYKLACNHYIPNHAKLIPFGNHTSNVDKTKDEGVTRYSWYALDFAHPDALEEGKDTSKGRNEFFTAKFKTPQIAQQFKDIFENDLETKTVNSDEDEITIVYDNMPAPELVSKAQSLKMSPFFYSYLEKKEPHDIVSSTPDNSNATLKTETKCMTCESLADESHIDNVNNGELLKSEGVKKEILSTDKEITPEKNETITATNKMIYSDKNGYLIDVSTQEYILFDERAKIYRFDSTEKAWKERGLGQMLILAHPSNPAQNSYAADNDEGEILRNIIESTRLLFRREQVLKLACNHRIDSTLKLVPGPTTTENKNKLGSDGSTSYTWRALDFSSEDNIVGTSLTLANGIEEKFTVRFKTSDQAKRFFDCVEACKIGKYPKPLTTKDLPQILSAIKSNTTPEIKPEHVETNDENDEDTINIKSQEITPPLIASSQKLNVCENNLTNFSKLFPTPAVKENEKSDKNITNLVGKIIDTSNERPFTLDNLKISMPSSSSTITIQNAIFSIPNTSILSGLSDETSSIFSIPSTTLTSNSSTLSFPKISFNFSTTLMSPNVTNSNAFNNIITGNKKQPLSLDNKATSNIVSTSNSLFGSGFGFNSGANTLSFAQLATNVTSSNNAPDGKLEETQSSQKASSISTENNPENNKTFGFQSGFGFGSNNTSGAFSFATLAASNAKTVVGDNTKKESDEIKPFWGSSTADNTKWTFGSSTNINPSLLTPKPLFASQNNSIQKSLSHTPVDNDEGGSGAEDSNDTLAAYDKTNEIINAPIVELVNVVTGEENETPIFNERAKLYRFDNNTKEWKERAVGQFKILKSIASSSDNIPSYRILMRREIIHKVACNHRITPTLKFEPFKSDPKGTSLTWQCMDYSEEPEFGSPPGRIETFTVRFKNVQMVQQFLECVTKCQNEIKN